jgi:AraC-like DNA-binding protein
MCLSLKSAAHDHFRELVQLRRVRDRIDTEYASPLDIEELARIAGLPVALFVRRFQDAYGLSPHEYRKAAEAVKNQEARPGRKMGVAR